jgi:FMN phosphatase YigB (HAD superfamily)
MVGMATSPKLIVTDIDNTLYDWVGFYVPCFLAMVDTIAQISGVDAEAIKGSFQRVHRRHGTSEYAFAIEELDVLDAIDPGMPPRDRVKKYDPAIEAFRRCRKDRLRLYPSVAETLDQLRRRGVRLVAHSDSMMVPVSRRLRQLDLDTHFDAICASRDSGIPDYLPLSVARVAPDSVVAARTELIELPAGVRKPHPDALLPLLQNLGVSRENVLYVGDSTTKDMGLAERCGVRGVLARYGRVVDPLLYAELVKITYWSSADIAAEGSARPVEQSDYAAIDDFGELLGFV